MNEFESTVFASEVAKDFYGALFTIFGKYNTLDHHKFFTLALFQLFSFQNNSLKHSYKTFSENKCKKMAALWIELLINHKCIEVFRQVKGLLINPIVNDTSIIDIITPYCISHFEQMARIWQIIIWHGAFLQFWRDLHNLLLLTRLPLNQLWKNRIQHTYSPLR